MPPVEKLLKLIDVLKSSEDKKKKELAKNEKIKLLNTVTDIICHHIDKHHVNYLNLLSNTCEILIYYFNDLTSDVRMKAEECFTIMTKTLVDYVNRIQVELYKEIKKNAQNRSLKVCLIRFALLVKHIRHPKFRAYISHLYPTIGEVAQRDEDSVQEILNEFLKLVQPVLGKYATFAETTQLLDAFANTFLTLESNASRRYCAESMAIIIQNCRHPVNHFEELTKRYLASSLSLQQTEQKKVCSILLGLKHLLKKYPTIQESLISSQANNRISTPKTSQTMLTQTARLTQLFQVMIDLLLIPQAFSRDQNASNLALEALNSLFTTIITPESFSSGTATNVAGNLWTFLNISHSPDVLKQTEDLFTNTKLLPIEKLSETPKVADEPASDVTFLPTSGLSFFKEVGRRSPSSKHSVSFLLKQRLGILIAKHNFKSFADSWPILEDLSMMLYQHNQPSAPTSLISDLASPMAPLNDLIDLNTPEDGAGIESGKALYQESISETCSVIDYTPSEITVQDIEFDQQDERLANQPVENQEYLKVEELQLEGDSQTIDDTLPDADDIYYDLIISGLEPNDNLDQKSPNECLLDNLVGKLLTNIVLAYRLDPATQKYKAFRRTFLHYSLNCDLPKPSHIRLSVQATALALLNALIKLKDSYVYGLGIHELISVSKGNLLLSSSKDRGESIKIAVKLDDILRCGDMRDPNVGCQVVNLLGSRLELQLSTKCWNTPPQMPENVISGKFMSLEDLIEALNKCISGDPSFASSPIIQSHSFGILRNLFGKNRKFNGINEAWIGFIANLPTLDICGYWLAKVNYVQMIEHLDFLEIRYWDHFILPKQRCYGKKLSGNLIEKVLSYIGDNDTRVRCAAINTISNLIPRMATDALALNDKCSYARLKLALERRQERQNWAFSSRDPTINPVHYLPDNYASIISKSSSNDLSFKDTELDNIVERLIEVNLSEIINRLLSMLTVHNSTSQVGVLEMLARLAQTYTPIDYPSAWNVLGLKSKCNHGGESNLLESLQSEEPIALSQSTFYAPKSNEPENLGIKIGNRNSILSLLISFLTNNPTTAENLALHPLILKLVTHIFMGQAYHNGQLLEYKIDSPQAQHWPAIKDRDLIATFEAYFCHLLRLLAICAHVLEGNAKRSAPNPVKPNSSSSVTLPTQERAVIGAQAQIEKFSSAVPKSRFHFVGMMNDLFQSSSSNSSSLKDKKDGAGPITELSNTLDSREKRMNMGKEAKKISETDFTEKDGLGLGPVKEKIVIQSPKQPSEGPPPFSYTAYEHIPLYANLFEILKKAYHSYMVTLKGCEDLRFYVFTQSVLECLKLALELTSYYEASKILDPVLQHLSTLFPLLPAQTIGCLIQLLKSLFGTNLTYYKQRMLSKKVDENVLVDDGQSFLDLLTPSSNLSADTTIADKEMGELNMKHIREKYLGWKLCVMGTQDRISSPLDRGQDKNVVSSYIQKFESLVIRALKLYTTTSNTHVQGQVLDLLIQLIILRINYRLLDADQIFVNFLLKQIDYVEEGYYDDDSELISKLFQFFSLLSRQDLHPEPVIITIPNLITLAESIIASDKPVDSLVFPAYFVLIQELFLTQNHDPQNGSNYDGEMLREVVIVALCRHIQRPTKVAHRPFGSKGSSCLSFAIDDCYFILRNSLVICLEKVQVLLTIILQVLKNESAIDPSHTAKWVQASARICDNLNDKIYADNFTNISPKNQDFSWLRILEKLFSCLPLDHASDSYCLMLRRCTQQPLLSGSSDVVLTLGAHKLVAFEILIKGVILQNNNRTKLESTKVDIVQLARDLLGTLIEIANVLISNGSNIIVDMPGYPLVILLNRYLTLTLNLITQGSHRDFYQILQEAIKDERFDFGTWSTLVRRGSCLDQYPFVAIKLFYLSALIHPEYIINYGAIFPTTVSNSKETTTGACYSLNSTILRMGLIFVTLKVSVRQVCNGENLAATLGVEFFAKFYGDIFREWNEPCVQNYMSALANIPNGQRDFIQRLDETQIPLWLTQPHNCFTYWIKAFSLLTSPPFDEITLLPYKLNLFVRHFFWLNQDGRARQSARQYVGHYFKELSSGEKLQSLDLLRQQLSAELLETLLRDCENASPFTKAKLPLSEIKSFIQFLYPKLMTVVPDSANDLPTTLETVKENKEIISNMFQLKIQSSVHLSDIVGHSRPSAPWFGQMCLQMDLDDFASFLTITDIGWSHLLQLYNSLKQSLYRKIVSTFETDYSKEATIHMMLTTKLYAMYQELTVKDFENSRDPMPSAFLACLQVINMHPSMRKILHFTQDWMEAFISVARSGIESLLTEAEFTTIGANWDRNFIMYASSLLMYHSKCNFGDIQEELVVRIIQYLSAILKPSLLQKYYTIKKHLDIILEWFDAYTDNDITSSHKSRGFDDLYRLCYHLLRLPKLNKYVLLKQPLNLGIDFAMGPETEKYYEGHLVESVRCESPAPEIYCNDIDAFTTLCNRILMLGWSDKHIFEEIWVILAAALNSISSNVGQTETNNASYETRLEQFHCHRLAVQASSVFFLYTSLIPYPGDPLYSQLPGTSQSFFKNIDMIAKYGGNMARLHKYFSLDTSSRNWIQGTPNWPLRDPLYPTMNLGQISLKYTWATMGLRLSRLSPVDSMESNDTILTPATANNQPLLPPLYGHSGYDLASCFQLSTDVLTSAVNTLLEAVKGINFKNARDSDLMFYQGITGDSPAEPDDFNSNPARQGSGDYLNEPGIPYRKLLLEVVKAIIYISDLFCTLPHFQWMQKMFCEMYDAFEDESDAGNNSEDELLMSYLTLGLAKSSAALAMSVPLCDSMRKVVESVLNHSSVASKMIGFKAALYLCEANPYANEALINHVADHGLALLENLTQNTFVSEPYVQVLLRTLFYLAETFQNVPVSAVTNVGPSVLTESTKLFGAIFSSGARPPYSDPGNACDTFVQKLVNLILTRLEPPRSIDARKGVLKSMKSLDSPLVPLAAKLYYKDFLPHSTRNAQIHSIMHLERLIVMNIVPPGPTFDAITYNALTYFKVTSAQAPYTTASALNGARISFSCLRLLLTCLYVGRDARSKLNQQRSLNASNTASSHQTDPATTLVLESVETLSSPASILIRSGLTTDLFVARSSPTLLPDTLTDFSFPSNAFDRLLAITLAVPSNSSLSGNPFVPVLCSAFTQTRQDDAPIQKSSGGALKMRRDWAFLAAEKVVASCLTMPRAARMYCSSIWWLGCVLVAACPGGDNTFVIPYLCYREASQSPPTSSDYELFRRVALLFFRSLNDVSFKQRFRDFFASTIRSFENLSFKENGDELQEELKCWKSVYNLIADNIDPLRDS